MRVQLNGRPAELEPGETVAQLLTRLGVEAGARGVAVAVDGDVVPRRDWDAQALDDGARVEVLTAMQGG